MSRCYECLGHFSALTVMLCIGFYAYVYPGVVLPAVVLLPAGIEIFPENFILKITSSIYKKINIFFIDSMGF